MRSASSVRTTAIGAVGAGVLAGAMLIGPVPPAQAASTVTVTSVDLNRGPDIEHVVGMGWRTAPLPEKPWGHGHGHGHGHWGKHWFWGNNGWHGKGHWKHPWKWFW
jgi:hypothetical protein